MEKLVQVKIGSIALAGALTIPRDAKGIVLFAHGSGSSRLSPRNTFVAHVLQKKGVATLLIDLLTEQEDETYETRFNIGLLVSRLVAIIDWLSKNSDTKNLPLGLFGASTGAASALKVAALLGEKVKAVVSRGGRPDLALDILDHVTSPTLLIVGAMILV